MSNSFNALRENKDIMHIKAFHDSFKVLSEIVGDVISDVMSNARLSSSEYERINTLLHNQHLLISMNDALEHLGRELKVLDKNGKTSALLHIAVEGLDTFLLSLMDIAADYNEEDLGILKNMASGERGGLSRIRESYLGAEADLDAGTKAILLSSTNHMDRLKSLFGLVGENYRKLSEAA